MEQNNNNIKMILNAATARQIFNIIESTVDKFKLNILPNGWSIKAVDPANVAVIAIELPGDEFDIYEAYHDPEFESVKVGIDVLTIQNFIDDGRQEIIVLPDDTQPIEFIFSKAPDKFQEKNFNRYQLQLTQGRFAYNHLLLPESTIRPELKIRPLPLDYMVQIKTIEIQRIIQKASKISDYIKLTVCMDDGNVTLTAVAGDDMGQPLTAIIPINTWQAHVIDPRQSVSSLYSLDYLNDFVKQIPGENENVYISIGNDYPIKISFNIGVNGLGKVEYILAPRIESK